MGLLGILSWVSSASILAPTWLRSQAHCVTLIARTKLLPISPLASARFLVISNRNGAPKHMFDYGSATLLWVMRPWASTYSVVDPPPFRINVYHSVPWSSWAGGPKLLPHLNPSILSIGTENTEDSASSWCAASSVGLTVVSSGMLCLYALSK